MPLETREIKLFGRDIPGFCRDIPEAPEKFEKKKFVFNFRSLDKISSQICVSKLQRVFTLGEGRWLPNVLFTLARQALGFFFFAKYSDEKT